MEWCQTAAATVRKTPVLIIKGKKVNQMAAFPKQASFLGSVAALTAVGNSFSLGIKGVCDGVGCSK